MERKQVYIASGWFNELQEEARQDLLIACNRLKVSFFSPKDEVVINNMSNKDDLVDAFNKDIEAISYCDILLSSPAGKDLGTCMEIGFATSLGKTIILYDKGHVVDKETFESFKKQMGDKILYSDNLTELEDILAKAIKNINKNVYVSPQLNIYESSDNEITCVRDIAKVLKEEGFVITDNLLDADWSIISTADKNIRASSDLGKSYFSKKPIVCYFKAPEHVPVNLMLACSTYKVCKNEDQLKEVIKDIKQNGFRKAEVFTGNVE